MLRTKEKGQGGDAKFKQGLRGLFKRSRDERKDTDKTSEDETFNKPSTSAQQNEHEDVTSSIQSAANTAEATNRALNYDTKLVPLKNATADVAVSELLVSTTSKNNLDPLFLATDDGQPLDIPQASQIENISSLWDDAYNALKEKDEDLIKKYEAIMKRDVMSIAGSANAVILGHSTVPRYREMRSLLEKKMDQVKQEERSVTLFGKKISVRDLAVPVVGVIRWAKEYVDDVVSPNPYASIAWAGVSFLLPVCSLKFAPNIPSLTIRLANFYHRFHNSGLGKKKTLTLLILLLNSSSCFNPSTQSASLDKALEAMSNVIVRSSMREELYDRQWQVYNKNSRQSYKNTLQELYFRVLKLQAKSIVYYSEREISRVGLDIIKWNDWESMIQDIADQETNFKDIYGLWKDEKCQIELEALERRHEEHMNIVKSIANDITSLKEAIEIAQKDKGRGELLNWLTLIDSSSSYNAALRKRTFNTGDWLIQENESFNSWKRSQNSFIWLNGKAGSGKSVLSSIIIKHLEDRYRDDLSAAVAYFSYSFADKDKQTLDGMLCSLIKQLCCRRPDTPESLLTLRECKDKGHRPDTESLQKLLAATFQGFSDVFLVIDALDECPSQNDEQVALLNFVCEIHKEGYRNLHLLCTSRREKEIGAQLIPLISSCGGSDINLFYYTHVLNNDIGLHIDKILATKTYESWTKALKTEVRETLINNADGMFQYVVCQFDELCKHRTEKKIRQALETLPKGLDATYDRILTNIDPEYQRQVANTLKWLAFSMRTLTLEEVAEIFMLDHEKDVPFDREDRLLEPEDVFKYLSSLVTTQIIYSGSYRSQYIILAHFSIKEYLTSSRMRQDLSKEFSTTENDAHLHISNCCLAYHLHFSKSILATTEEYRSLKLWSYAAQTWYEHLERVSTSTWTPSVTNRVLDLLTPKAEALLNMTRFIYGFTGDMIDITDLAKALNRLSPPLYYMAALGARKVSTLLIDRGADINAVKGYYGTALQVACSGGKMDIVNLLLDRNADINAKGGYFGTALQAASYEANEKLVQLLLNRGADINAVGGGCGNALNAASEVGSKSVVQLLLDQNADINAEAGIFGTAIQTASYYGHKYVVKLLVDRGAEVNRRGGRYGNAIQAAVVRGEVDIIKYLFGKGAKLMRRDELVSWPKDGWDIKDVDRIFHCKGDPLDFIAFLRYEENMMMARRRRL